MTMKKRPNLSHLDKEILNYIEALEEELATYQKDSRSEIQTENEEQSLQPELPTTMNLVTVSYEGMIKRTYRHLYSRQRRGGMGVFDLDIPETDAPRFIFTADESQDLLIITDYGHAYRLPLNAISESSVRNRGQLIDELIKIPEGENVNVILPAFSEGYLAILSNKGNVRTLRHNYVGKNMQPWTSIFDVGKYGLVVASTWTSGKDDLFIATRKGLGIRFPEKLVQTDCKLGINLNQDDEVISVSGVKEDSGVFLATLSGQGTIRLMSGFRANKVPGASGKIAIKTDHLVGAIQVNMDDDVFIITKLSKIIRFPAEDIPAKTGVVQGVNCISLRADKVVAIAT